MRKSETSTRSVQRHRMAEEAPRRVSKFGKVPTPVADRILAKVEKLTECGCWIFMGGLHLGYGQVGVGSKADGTRRGTTAHRALYEALRGPVPPGLELDHLCRVRSCVNPDHLEPVTQQENNRRGMSLTAIHARKACCPRCGGAYRRYPNGTRYCRPCPGGQA